MMVATISKSPQLAETLNASPIKAQLKWKAQCKVFEKVLITGSIRIGSADFT